MMWLYFVAFLTGIFASMGVGGGMILIIYLTVFEGTSQLSAQGINLIYFIPIAVLSVILHSFNKLIEWKKIVPSILIGVITAAIGAFAAEMLGSDFLQKIYGFFVLSVGIKELFSSPPKQTTPIHSAK